MICSWCWFIHRRRRSARTGMDPGLSASLAHYRETWTAVTLFLADPVFGPYGVRNTGSHWPQTGLEEVCDRTNNREQLMRVRMFAVKVPKLLNWACSSVLPDSEEPNAASRYFSQSFHRHPCGRCGEFFRPSGLISLSLNRKDLCLEPMISRCTKPQSKGLASVASAHGLASIRSGGVIQSTSPVNVLRRLAS